MVGSSLLPTPQNHTPMAYYKLTEEVLSVLAETSQELQNSAIRLTKLVEKLNDEVFRLKEDNSGLSQEDSQQAFETALHIVLSNDRFLEWFKGQVEDNAGNLDSSDLVSLECDNDSNEVRVYLDKYYRADKHSTECSMNVLEGLKDGGYTWSDCIEFVKKGAE